MTRGYKGLACNARLVGRCVDLSEVDTAPDGSEIRLLREADAGGFAHYTLEPGSCSAAVRHRTVDEIWFVLGGHGAIWRSSLKRQLAKVVYRHLRNDHIGQPSPSPP